MPETIRYRLFCDLLTLLVLLMVAVAFVPYGELNLTYDSHDFISASESLEVYLHGKNQEGFSYLTRAPLLPAYLHFFNNKVSAAWWLNMFSLTGSILLIFRIGRTLNIKEFLLYPLVVVATLTYPWLLNHFFLWSEPLFIFIILALTYCMIRRKSFVTIMIICVLLFLLRKAGIFFFVSAGVWYISNRDWKHAIITMITALVVFVSWQILEHAYGSTGTFLAMLNKLEMYDRIFYAEAITSWLLPMIIPLYLRTILFILTIGGIIFFSKEIFKNLFREDNNKVLVIVALVYMICMIGFSGTTGYMDAERYLNVVLPLWMLLLFSLAGEIHTAGGMRSKFFLGALALWIIYPLSRTIYHLL